MEWNEQFQLLIINIEIKHGLLKLKRIITTNFKAKDTKKQSK